MKTTAKLFITMALIVIQMVANQTSFAAQTFPAGDDGAVLFYVNGVNKPNEQDVAFAAFILQEKMIHFSVQGVKEVKYLYNPSDTALLDVFSELAAQKSAERNVAFADMFVQVGLAAWGYVSPLSQADQDQIHAKVATAIDSFTLSSSTANLVNQFRDTVAGSLQNGNKAILVAHSQGNLFANAVYNAVLANVPQATYQGLAVVNVANPAASAPSNLYVTVNQDRVINLLATGQAALGGSLYPMPANFDASGALSKDLTGHGFTEVYLARDLPAGASESASISARVATLVSQALALAQPPTVTPSVTPPVTTAGPSVSGTTGTATMLSVTINKNGTGYYLVQSATAATPSVAAVQAGTSFAMAANVAAAQSISGLTPSTAYKIYFVAKDTANNVQTAVSSVEVTTATAADVTPPVTTAIPSVSGTTSSGTTLSATINENGTGYYYVLSATAATPSVAAVQAGTSFAMTANVAATPSISGLTPSTAYKIYFVAKDTANNVQTAVSSVAVTTAAAADVTPPVTTAIPSISGTTSTGTTLSVTINENGTGYYLVQAATAAAPSVAAVQAGTSFAMTANVAETQNISGLTPSTDYKIYFVAKDTANNVQTAVSSIEVTTAAAAPTGVTATAGNGQVTISWNAVAGATSYNVYQSPVSGVTKSNYISLGGMKWAGWPSPLTLISMTNGKTYYFVVTAVNANGESIESTQMSATPTAAAVNGACGSANGVSVSSAPTSGFCSAGTASSVTGSGPWYWSCSGSNGGTNASCTAPKQTTAGYVSQGGLTWMPVWFTKNWTIANAFCTGDTINGQTGWRLPTRDELVSLYNSNAMNGQGWILTPTWSSTPYGTGTHYGVNLYNGFVYWFNDTNPGGVTCVHSNAQSTQNIVGVWHGIGFTTDATLDQSV